MIWAAEEYALRCAIKEHDRVISCLDVQRGESTNGMERTRMALSDDVKQECAVRLEKFVWCREIPVWR